jgi:hypothetical protein
MWAGTGSRITLHNEREALAKSLVASLALHAGADATIVGSSRMSVISTNGRAIARLPGCRMA